jgi:glucose/arabinose dehydrogenase
MESPKSTRTQNRSLNLNPFSLTALAILVNLLLIAGCKKTDTSSTQSPGSADKLRNDIHLAQRGDLDLQTITDGLVSPVTLVEPPDGSHRLFVLDQVGQIWIIEASGHKLSQPFMDVSSKMVTLSPFYDERGLLGLAFHPNFKQNGRFYLFYTAPPPPGGPSTDAGNTGLPKVWDNTTRISEFKVSASNPNLADMSSERIILEEPHPQSNHNGGTIAFGPDGFLYISIGDGGNKNDIGPGHVEDWYAVNAGGNGQDIEQNLLGNILRIDVNGSSEGKSYAIPPDNPFVGKRGLDEIYAYGFRNPYRFSFDMGGSGRLLVGDAGQNLYEEVSVVTKGGNYGWNVKEGTHCFNAANELMELSSCPDADAFGNPLLDPVLEMKNHDNPAGGNFVVVVGGYVYRGHSIPGLEGKYVFGNFSTDEDEPEGEVYVSNPGGPGLWSFEKVELKSFPENIGRFLKGFGQDLGGEIYVLASTELGPAGNTGIVYKLVASKKEH